jgi:hypothetical protein
VLLNVSNAALFKVRVIGSGEPSHHFEILIFQGIVIVFHITLLAGILKLYAYSKTVCEIRLKKILWPQHHILSLKKKKQQKVQFVESQFKKKLNLEQNFFFLFISSVPFIGDVLCGHLKTHRHYC